MSRAVKTVASRTGGLGLALGVLLVLSGLGGLAVVDVHDAGNAALLVALHLLLGTAVVVRFTIGRHRTPHA
ncbi:hypothetical protein CLV92_10953 [Kineococcus xinjiangensis]|uniref:Uncharacterized protein n=1 Tax=Kineococcus xinjiangensis TaxID=512762 RepID=A0A2S6IHT8_9ACTN|nr:hypothetical protein [Kineococcus xinjiangensis]PPK93777.1 hypothetical protein CLV92_10953 [Kineococcus xinjiangensis]